MFILFPELGKNVNPSRESDRFSYPNFEQFEIFLIVISSQKSKGKSNCNDLKVQNIAPAAGYIRGHNFWCKNSILVFSHFQLKSPRSGENFWGCFPCQADPPSPGFTHLSRCFNFFSSLKPYGQGPRSGV